MTTSNEIIVDTDLITADLVDSHCHFDFSAFDHGREQLWAQCQSSGIKKLLIPGVSPETWQEALTLTEQLPGVFMAAGLHPWWVDRSTLPEQGIWRDVLAKPQCVAVGECGLDGAIETPMSIQLDIFTRHIKMAIEVHLPLVIHVRQTHNETIRLLKRYRPPAGGVIHGFTGSYEIAMEYWRLGFYLGVGGSITYPRASKTRKAIQSMPLESLLLETDAPDMPLYGYQGEPNSPLQLLNVAKELAQLHQQTPDDVCRQTTANSYRLFAF